MSNTNVTIFNGTFQKLNGERRTMRFIRKSDIPTLPDEIVEKTAAEYQTIFTKLTS